MNGHQYMAASEVACGFLRVLPVVMDYYSNPLIFAGRGAFTSWVRLLPQHRGQVQTMYSEGLASTQLRTLFIVIIIS